MRLHLPPQNLDLKLDFLSDKEMKIVADQIWKDNTGTPINTLIVTPNEEDLPTGWDPERLQKLREELHKDFDGTALRHEIEPDPPVRGIFGYAYIPLIENAVPTRQKPF